jgi:hypothetical protein
MNLMTALHMYWQVMFQKKVTSPVQHQTSFSDTNIVGHQPSETVFPGVSISPSIFSQITDGQAVPVALHANIDNINRDLSTSQLYIGSCKSIYHKITTKMSPHPPNIYLSTIICTCDKWITNAGIKFWFHEFESRSWWGIHDTTFCDKGC